MQANNTHLNPFNTLPPEINAIIAARSDNPHTAQACKKLRDAFSHPEFFQQLEQRLQTTPTVMGLSNVGSQAMRQTFAQTPPDRTGAERIKHLFLKQQKEADELKKQHNPLPNASSSLSFVHYLSTDRWIDRCNDQAIKNTKSRKGILKRTFRPDGIILTRVTDAIKGYPGLTKLILIDNHVRVLTPECDKLTKLKKIVISNQDLATLPLSLSSLPNLQSIEVDRTPGLTVPPELSKKVKLNNS